MSERRNRLTTRSSHIGRTAGKDFSQIRAGDRVTIVDRFGQKHTGRAVMQGPGRALNMGGPHGTPGIANESNIVKVSPGCSGRESKAALALVTLAKELISGVSVGDVLRVDMRVVKQHSSESDFGTGHWVRVVGDTVKYGGGKVKVLAINGNNADVIADSPMGGVMGSVRVPLDALR